MKGLLHIACLAALLASASFPFQSCGKADNPVGEDPRKELEYAGGEITIKARIEDSMQSKVSYPSSGGSVWNGGDRITVFAVDSSGVIFRRYEFSSIEDGNEITFHGRIPAGYKLTRYAVYPHSSKHSADALQGSFVLGVYNGDISCKDVGDGPVQMVGICGEDDNTYVFHHCAGELRLSLVNMPSGELTVTLTASTNTKGRYQVDLDTFLLQQDLCELGSPSFSVKTHADDLGNASVVFPLPVGKYSGISVSVADSQGGEVMQQSFPDPVTVKAGQFEERSMELVIDTKADFSRWMRTDTTFVNHIETEDLAQHGQLLNGCDTLFYMFDSRALYGYISVPITTASLKAQLRKLRVFIDHYDDQTTEFNPIYDLGWLDQHAHYDLLFEGDIYQSGRIRKIEDGQAVMFKICPTQQPTEDFGWMGGVERGNGTHETISHGFTGSGVLQEDGRFRYQFELQRDVALITPADLKKYTLEGKVTGLVNVMVVVTDKSYSHSSICPDREGTDLYMLN